MIKLNKSTIAIFLTIFIPVSLIWTGLIVNNMIKEKEFLIESIISESAIENENTSVLVERYMSEIIENIKVIRDADELKMFLETASEENYRATTEMFKRVMDNKEAYDQVRYIDANGDERIRVETKEGNKILVDESLQNKSDRYYFKEALQLQNNEIYISPLDLNVENDEIEEPYKAMIRFAIKVYNSQNDLKGILIVNYSADYFVELLNSQKQDRDLGQVDLYVLNGEGAFISHPDEQLDFSYMFNDTAQVSFEDDHQKVWMAMQDNNYKGSYIKNDMIYTYYDILSEVTRVNRSYSERWIAVQALDVSNVFSIKAIATRLFFTYNVIVFIIIIIGSFLLTFFSVRIQSKEDQLEITKKVAESTNDAVIITNSKTEIQYVNRAYEEATGYTYDEVIGFKPSQFKSGKHSKEFYEEMWRTIEATGQWEGMLWDKKQDGLLYPKKLQILAVKDKKNNKTHHYVGIFSDLSAYKRKSDTYETIDYKKGELVIPNEEMMIELLGQSIKSNKFDFMVLYIKIENYSQLLSFIEDEALNISVVFTEIIKPLLRGNDFIAQTGRNLFAVIIGTELLKVSREEFVNNFHKELGKVLVANGRNIFFKTKVGVSFWPHDTNVIKKLLLNSMIALEWTSHKKDSEIAFFNEEMIEELSQENQIEGYLRKAIDKNELSIVYQPQVDIVTEKIVGMEALIRWNNEFLGFVSPAIFIPIAEKNHLMVEIGDWVIQKVCEELKIIDEGHLIGDNVLKCAINLSVIQIEEIGFTDKLFAYIDESGIKGNQLEMEITESLLLTNETEMVEILNKIKEKAITIAIDDFGTGYSSLSYLNTMPIDKIKIDRSFIKNYPETDDGKLAKILVEMSKKLEMKVLVEGAETKEQIQYLKNVGCDYIQGFYYSKPLSMKQLVEYVNRH